MNDTAFSEENSVLPAQKKRGELKEKLKNENDYSYFYRKELGYLNELEKYISDYKNEIEKLYRNEAVKEISYDPAEKEYTETYSEDTKERIHNLERICIFINSIEKALYKTRINYIELTDTFNKKLEIKENSEEKDRINSLSAEEKFAVSDKKHYENDHFSSFITSDFCYFRLPELTLRTKYNEKHYDFITNSTVKNYIQSRLSEYKNKVYGFSLWEKYTVIFVHNFNINSCLPDTDNINIKKAVDALLSVWVTDDTMIQSHIFQITKETEHEPFTEMYVIKGHKTGDTIYEILQKLLLKRGFSEG